MSPRRSSRIAAWNEMQPGRSEHIGEGTTAVKAPKSSGTRVPTTMPGALEPADSPVSPTFYLFPTLPLEIQSIIWDFASIFLLQSSPRIHQIAPDPTEYLSDTWPDELADDPQFKILRGKSGPVPSLLHVSREARRSALKQTSLWPTAEIVQIAGRDSYKRDGKHIYVNKEHDVFYLRGDEYQVSFLYLMSASFDERYNRTSNEYINILTPTFSKLLDHINGVRHLAISWTYWRELLELGTCTKWLRNLPWLQDLSLVIEEDWPSQADLSLAVKFADVVPNSQRGHCASLMLRWSRGRLNELPLEFPEQIFPNLRVVSLHSSDHDDQSLSADSDFVYEIMLGCRLYE